MMYKMIFILFLVCSIPAFGQTIPEVEIEEIDEESDIVPFSVIENVPVYKNCDENLSNAELKKCMIESISGHVVRNFNINVAKGLGLPDGIARINIIFTVNKEGEVKDIKVRGPHTVLEKEAFRIISLIPKFEKPGYQRGKPVTVPYSLPIVFNIDNSQYLSKKERKNLKNKKELP